MEAGRVAVRKVVEAREVDRAAASVGRAAEARVADGDGGASELRRWRDPATDLHRWWVAGGRCFSLVSPFTLVALARWRHRVSIQKFWRSCWEFHVFLIEIKCFLENELKFNLLK